jgi:hypothetical protein
VRGGIDVGLGLEIFDGEYYGRALVEAYRLESNEAQYPRVLVGSGLTRYLDATEKAAPTFDARVAEIVLQAVRTCRELLLLADPDDHKLAVDPLIVTTLEDGSARAAELGAQVVSRAQTMVREFRNQGNKELAQRYERLGRFLDASPYRPT